MKGRGNRFFARSSPSPLEGEGGGEGGGYKDKSITEAMNLSRLTFQSHLPVKTQTSSHSAFLNGLSSVVCSL
jgi:hypothetical protein